jgi:hypothetical protein
LVIIIIINWRSFVTNKIVFLAAAAGGIALATSASAMPLNSLARQLHAVARQSIVSRRIGYGRHERPAPTFRLIRIALPFSKADASNEMHRLDAAV